MYAYIDSFRKFGKTNTDNQSIKIKRPYPSGRRSFFGEALCHKSTTPLLASTPSSTASPEAQLHRQEGSWAGTRSGIHTETRTETQARTQANANRNADRNKGRYARRNAHRNAHRNRAQKSDAKIRRENPTQAIRRTARTLRSPSPLSQKKGSHPEGWPPVTDAAHGAARRVPTYGYFWSLPRPIFSISALVSGLWPRNLT